MYVIHIVISKVLEFKLGREPILQNTQIVNVICQSVICCMSIQPFVIKMWSSFSYFMFFINTAFIKTSGTIAY
jgi:hypothetical protein